MGGQQRTQESADSHDSLTMPLSLVGQSLVCSPSLREGYFGTESNHTLTECER